MTRNDGVGVLPPVGKEVPSSNELPFSNNAELVLSKIGTRTLILGIVNTPIVWLSKYDLSGFY